MKIFGGTLLAGLISFGLLAGGTGCMPDLLAELLPIPNIKNNPVSRVTPVTPTNPVTDPTPEAEVEEELTDTYIVSFKGANGFAPRTAAELLAEFDKKYPQGVRTHHYRTRIEGMELIGMICVDTVSGKNKIASMVNSNTNLILVGIKQATNKDLDQHYALGQPGL